MYGVLNVDDASLYVVCFVCGSHHSTESVCIRCSWSSERKTGLRGQNQDWQNQKYLLLVKKTYFKDFMQFQFLNKHITAHLKIKTSHPCQA